MMLSPAKFAMLHHEDSLSSELSQSTASQSSFSSDDQENIAEAAHHGAHSYAIPQVARHASIPSLEGAIHPPPLRSRKSKARLLRKQRQQYSPCHSPSLQDASASSPCRFDSEPRVIHRMRRNTVSGSPYSSGCDELERIERKSTPRDKFAQWVSMRTQDAMNSPCHSPGIEQVNPPSSPRVFTFEHGVVNPLIKDTMETPEKRKQCCRHMGTADCTCDFHPLDQDHQDAFRGVEQVFDSHLQLQRSQSCNTHLQLRQAAPITASTPITAPVPFLRTNTSPPSAFVGRSARPDACLSKADHPKVKQHKDSLKVRGDRLKPCALPTVSLLHRFHSHIRQVMPSTVKDLIDGKYESKELKYLIIDCRFPYEYAGGHIQGAKNFWTRDQILQNFIDAPVLEIMQAERIALIFHCEFSAARGPGQYQFLREVDLRITLGSPNLIYPEMYVMHGGYEKFNEQFPEYCTSQGNYVRMDDKQFSREKEMYQNRLTHSKQSCALNVWEKLGSVCTLAKAVQQVGFHEALHNHWHAFEETLSHQASSECPATPQSQVMKSCD
eukprot:m.151356 g.151356  ORF g.151356 m.151356 type:complete len:553 (-) comp14248_c0_seq9:522-2180(-)